MVNDRYFQEYKCYDIDIQLVVNKFTTIYKGNSSVIFKASVSY